MKNRFYLISACIMIVSTLVPFFAMAQTDPGCGPDCPIDGGLSVLLAAGVGYGVKKYRDGRKKEKEQLGVSN
jgi:hypothetical protein